MSYDLMVFVPNAALNKRKDFLTWYGEITKWGQEHDYSDPTNSAPILQFWYRDMIGTFPALGGPHGVSEDDPTLDSGYATEYCCADQAIYTCFAWSLAKEAYDHSLMYAATNEVGFFDVSATDGAVWMPTEAGYKIIHGGTGDDRKVEEALAEWLASRH